MPLRAVSNGRLPAHGRCAKAGSPMPPCGATSADLVVTRTRVPIAKAPDGPAIDEGGDANGAPTWCGAATEATPRLATTPAAPAQMMRASPTVRRFPGC